MRSITRATLVSATALPLAMAAPALASAPTASDVSFVYTVSGSTVTNTITNNSGMPLQCGTLLGDAPGGVLPPVEDTLRAGQTIGTTGEMPAGATAQVVTDIPDGSYVVLATCTSSGEETSIWISDYPGIEPYLTVFPYTVYTVPSIVGRDNPRCRCTHTQTGVNIGS